MINAALVGVAVGGVVVLAVTGLLVYAGIRKQAQYVWKRALSLEIFGMVLLAVCVVYLVARVGQCNNNVTC